MLLKSDKLNTCPISGASTGASLEHANPVGASVLVYNYGNRGRDISASYARHVHRSFGTYITTISGHKRCVYQKWIKGKMEQYYRSRIIWAIAHGQIPPYHQIHHRDGNTLNDSLDNLECLSAYAHEKLHMVLMTNKRIAAGKNTTERYTSFYDWLVENDLDHVTGNPYYQIDCPTTAQSKDEFQFTYTEVW